ncbi:hypothetical protein AC1031_013787 [Aphanomyces cochlioides]|nr:hypothetical protein AC1031_013787 [Aphanomyces cochlioides]
MTSENPLGVSAARNSAQADALYYIFSSGPRRQKVELALGTARKLSSAKKLEPNTLAAYPRTKAAAVEFQIDSSSSLVDWVVWQSSSVKSNENTLILSLVKPGKRTNALCTILAQECKEMGIEPTVSNFKKYKIPFPIPIHQILRVVNHEHVFTFNKAPHSRLISRKRAKLLKALTEYSLVAHVHVNGQTPSKSFVRVEKPQEHRFLSGEEFDDVASFLHERLEKPRDATKLLLSLQQNSQRYLVKYAHQLVAEVEQSSSADWANRPPWVPSDIEWCDPLQQIYSPNFCGPVEFNNGRVILLADA